MARRSTRIAHGGVLLLVVGLVAVGLAPLGCGELDNEDFSGWIDDIEGSLLLRPELGDPTHLIHTARVPCVGCFRHLPTFDEVQLVLRMVSPEGPTLVLKITAEDLNADELVFSFGQSAEPVQDGNVYTLPAPGKGGVSAWLGLEPFDEGGTVTVVDAVWPAYPGDTGYATLEIEGASFDDAEVSGAFTVNLSMHRKGDQPAGTMGPGSPCVDYECAEGLACVPEHEGLVCRWPCVSESECGPDEACSSWPGLVGTCREPPLPGQRDQPCDAAGGCEPGLFCAEDERCRQPCQSSGFDPACGGSSRCRMGQCQPAVEPGYAHGPCRQNRCDLVDLVCIAEEDGPICRSTCTPAEPETCGQGYRCVTRRDGSAVCQPRD